MYKERHLVVQKLSTALLLYAYEIRIRLRVEIGNISIATC
jgi:hypothetical protein